MVRKYSKRVRQGIVIFCMVITPWHPVRRTVSIGSPSKLSSYKSFCDAIWADSTGDLTYLFIWFTVWLSWATLRISDEIIPLWAGSKSDWFSTGKPNLSTMRTPLTSGGLAIYWTFVCTFSSRVAPTGLNAACTILYLLHTHYWK